MALKVGIEVRFLNEPISGKVYTIDNQGNIEIETKEGFIIKTKLSNVVTVHPMEETLDHFQELSESLRIKEGFLVDKIPQSESLEIIREFDLHIEELGIAYKNLTNSEILKIQLQFFENKLGKSINEKISPITFIHGVGNGILRQEIHKKLKKNPLISHFENKGKDRNGFGATEVFLRI